MKLKKRRASEVPPKIKDFINSVITAPFESIEEPLKIFVWDFDKGDFHHWVDLFNHFDAYFEKYIKPRKDLQLEDDFLNFDPPFPKDAVLQILRVVRCILENCTNKHFYSSYEQHLSSLLASTDADVVEASLQTLASFLKKTLGKYSIRDAALNSKLFAFAQGWGGKEEGLGLTACAVENQCDSIAYQLGCVLHFEFYAVDDSSSGSSSGLQIIHLPNVNSCVEPDLELLHKLVKQHKVPANLRFQLLTRLRFARAFGSFSSRHQYMCIRLYAFVVLVQASTETNDLVSFLNSEPEFINELVSLLSFEDDVPEKVRILSLLSLVALCQDRSRQPTVLAAVTSGGHRGILSSLMQKSIDSVLHQSSKWSVIFAEALLSLVTVLVSSSSGCSAMREAGFIPTLLPLLKDTDPQHLHLVSTAVHVLEAFMDYSNPAAALFRDLGGLDDTISRLKEEVSAMENVSKKLCEDSSSGSNRGEEIAGTSALDDVQPLYSEAMVAYHRRLLLKALLRAISLGTYAPGNTTHIYSSEESLLPHCLCVIFRRAKDFGGGVFSLAATVTSDLIHKDPTSFSVLDAAGLPSAFMDAIMDSVPCSAEAITCIPQCLDALCLNNSGIQAVKDRNALSCFVKIFTSKSYLRALSGDTPASLSTGLDELMRHASALRVPGVEMLIEILNTIGKIGCGADASSSSADSVPSSSIVPMDTDAEEKSLSTVEGELLRVESIDPAELPCDVSAAHVETFLPDLVINVARLLETILQNADMCRIFVEKKGIDAVLQIFTLPLLPLSVSVGQSISFAFKNFSHQYSASLARTVCPFLKEHLFRTNELLASVNGTLFLQLESAKQTKLLKCLSSLEGILALSISLLKGTAPVVSELGAGDADVLKDLGRTYREVMWQISLICDSKVDEKPSVDVENGSTSAASANGTGRESDDDIPLLRFMTPLSVRNAGIQSQWSGERDFISMIRSGEGLSRRSRHSGMTRIRGARTGRHMDAINLDTDNLSCVPESSSSQESRKMSPDVLASEILDKIASTTRSFFAALVKGFTSPNRRRADSAPLSLAAKNIGAALAKVFLEALSFSGHPTTSGPEISLSVKCRYLGKIVDDMAAVTFDSRRRLCYASIVNNLYVSGAFKELLTTFEATSQLLWNLPPYSIDSAKSSDRNSALVQYSWLFETLQSYCRVLECFVNSSLLLSPSSSSHSQLLIQPAAVGLSIGLFPVPRDPEVFVRMLQSQVLDVIFPVWNHPMFPSCIPSFVTSILSLVTYIYSGVGDIKHNRGPAAVNVNQRVAPPPDETTISTIVEMGFSRARVEEALRRVGSNSIEMAMEWLCSHVEDPVQEDDELARALALSLGNSTETSKGDSAEKSVDVSNEEGKLKPLPVDDILATLMKLVQSGGDSMAFALTDLLVTLSSRNKGEDRLKVTSYLVQQLKDCPLDFEKDSSLAATISHVLALLLSEDSDAREVAAQNGLIPVALDILSNFRTKNATGGEIKSTRCISAVLLIVDRLLQARPRVSPERSSEATSAVSYGPAPAEGNASISIPEPTKEKQMSSDYQKDEFGSAFAEVLGKSTGYLSMEESHSMLCISCDLLKQYVPAVVMQAVLQLFARLTKTHSLALQFLEIGGMTYLFNLPRNCFFPGYDTMASAIVRHLLEDPHTLQTAMESEIRQVLSGSRHSGRVASRTFLTSMASMISRDPVVFMKAASAVCQLETSGGRNIVVLTKDKEKDKDRPKAETGLCSNDSLKIPEMRLGDGPGKSPRSHKKIPTNLTQVLDLLLEIVFQFPSAKGQEDCVNSSTSMEVDDTVTKVKGKSKIDETKKIEMDSFSEKSALLAKVTFVLKLLSEILLMYSPAVAVILRRDSELCQPKGSCQIDALGQGGIVHHVLQRVLPVSVDESAGPNDLRLKLAEKASCFLVVLCGRSGEGRKRVISELVKALSLCSTVEGNSMMTRLLPDQKILAFAELVYCILSKNSPSSNLPVSGYSPDIAKSMIDGGTIPCLTNILQVIDLDHPEAPKVSNLILKALEVLTRAANSSNDLASKTDASNKKRMLCSQARPEEQVAIASTDAVVEPNQTRTSGQEGVNLEANVSRLHHEEAEHPRGSSDGNQDGPSEQDTGDNEGGGAMTLDMAANPPIETGSGFAQDEMDEGGMLPSGTQLHVNYHVENRAEEDIGDEDDDMGDEGDEEDDEDEVEEDEDIAEDGTPFMSLADTDVDDHEDVGLGDEYNDELVDEEDDEFHENRVIEVRWREALGGFGHLQVLGQSGSSLIDASSDTFEGVNVDDLFGLRRSLGFERRRQTNNRSSLDRTNTGTDVQHPLLSRPSSGVGSAWASTGHASRASELFQGLVPPPLTDYSLGVDSLHLSGRRVAGDGRWADDGQPQAGGQASSIAEAVEDLFVSVLRSSGGEDEVANAQNNRETMTQTEVQENQDGISELERHESGSEHREGYTGEDASHERLNLADPSSDNLGRTVHGDDIVSSNVDVTYNVSNGQPSMDIGDDSGVLQPQIERLPDLAVLTGDLHNIAHAEEHSQVAQVTDESQDVQMQPIGGDESVVMCTDLTSQLPTDSCLAPPSQVEGHPSATVDVDLGMSGANVETLQTEHLGPQCDVGSSNAPASAQPASVAVDANHNDQTDMEDDGPGPAPASTGIDPTFLEALPDDLRAEVLASQQSQSVEPPAYNPPSVEDIDPEFLAALPPDIQAEVLAQQRAQRVASQAVGQPVEMDNASIIATLPADLREEVLLTSSEAVIAELPSPLQAEAQMLRDRTMSHYQAHSLLGSRHRLTSRRNGLGFGQNSLMNRGVGVTIGRRLASSHGDGLKEKEIEGEPLLDPDSLNALIRLLRLAQPLSKGLLQRLMLNLCAHSVTRATLVRLLLNMIKPEADGMVGSITTVNAHRLYGCPSNIVYGRSQLLDGLPPLVLRRVLEALTYLATNHSAVANILFYFDPSLLSESSSPKQLGSSNAKGKEKIKDDDTITGALDTSLEDGIPFVLFLRLLNQPLFICSVVHLEQVMGLLQVIVCTAASKLEHQSIQDQIIANAQDKNVDKPSEQKDVPSGMEPESTSDKDTSEKSLSKCEESKGIDGQSSGCLGKRGNNIYDVFLQLPQSDLCNLSRILGHEGLSDKVYTLAGDVLKKLASVVPQHRNFFALELSACAQDLCQAAVSELSTLKSTNMTGLSAGSRAGIAVLRVLRALSSLTSSSDGNSDGAENETEEQEDEAILRKLNGSLEPLWEELSECISLAETQLEQSNSTQVSATSLNVWDNIHRVPSSSPSVPPGTQRLLPFIEAFFVLCEKLQSNNSLLQQDHANITAIEVKESGGSGGPPLSPAKYGGGDPHRKLDGVVTFARFAEKHRRLLNVFLRQNAGLLEKSLSMMLKAPRLIDFDNKKAHFRSRIRQQHEQHLTGPLRISVRRAYVLEDSYNQLRMRSTHDLKGRLNVHFQGEEGIDAGGLTREWYQLLSRVIFDKGALLFTTVGNNATFQPNPNSVYQTEHLSYFKFVGRVVAKALFDGQLLDVYFTRSFYKHILGVKVTYHDIEAVDPDYYKNLKWMLENDVSDIPDMTFSMDADEEKHILYEKTEVTDFELKPGGRNIRVTEETKHEYVDLVADHILTNAIRPQITSFLQGFNELVPRELISIFNDKELELLISGLPEIDLEDLKGNTEYTGYVATSSVVQWFWEVVGSFSKEDMARFLQFVTGTSKVPFEGFRALQGISGPQRFQIHKAYGAPERLPSAHTCFNQLDLPEYPSKEQLKDRLLLAIHEASEGFGFG